MRSLGFLLRNLDHFRRDFYLLVLAGMLDGAALFGIPLFIAEITRSPLAADQVWPALQLTCCLVVASLVFQRALRRKGEALMGNLANHLHIKLFRSLEDLPATTLARYHSGYLLSLVNQVADGIGGLSTTIVWLIGHAGITLTLFFICTARESLLIAILNTALLIVFLIVSTILARRISMLAESENHRRASVMERFADFMANIFTVKKLGIREFAIEKVTAQADLHNRSIDEMQTFHANRWLLLHGIFFTSYLSTLYVLLRGIASGWVAASLLVIFVAAFSQVRSYIERISELLKRCMELNAYLATLTDVLGDGLHLIEYRKRSRWQSMSAQGLHFRYQDTAAEVVIDDFSLAPGERVVVTGQSGQGKTTLLNIMAGFLFPRQGVCKLDGVEYSSLFQGELTSLIALVSQETELLNLSLRENATVGGSVSDEQLTELLEALALGPWLRSLPQGLDTIVGEKGLRLSSGQKQRVNIARALLMNRPILFMDEPTSHMDNETEAKVIECLERHLVGKTALIVSHRPALARLATSHRKFSAGRLGPAE